ncbi:MAG: riboflavin biosynthesis protein RibD, partial [Sulfurospirillum sp.]
MVADHAFYMQLALNEAWKYQALTYPNPPVGALILDKNGKILSV